MTLMQSKFATFNGVVQWLYVNLLHLMGSYGGFSVGGCGCGCVILFRVFR
jgi:hypothetical protein